MKTYIGCSGFHYSDWKKKFYPEDLPKKNWLEFYAEQFNTVEINNTFYKMPEEKDLKKWKETTPASFQFTLKANRYFTHQKKLNIDDDFKDRFSSFMDAASVMDKKLGCILWQLPRNQHKDVSKIESLGKLLNDTSHHVIEFRHESWFDEEVYGALSDYKLSFCILSAPDKLPEETLATSKVAYLRLHGKKDWYRYNYSDNELKTWHKRLKGLKNVTELYVYFNNDYEAHAVENAKTLKSYFE